jgi:hypothetical protein
MASNQLAAPETFRFACLKELPCFTRCCADPKLVLTPYDILLFNEKTFQPKGPLPEETIS